jgi:hypothetical protein
VVGRQEQVRVVVVKDGADVQPDVRIGAPIGFRVASVGMLQTRSPVSGLLSFEERKPLYPAW